MQTDYFVNFIVNDFDRYFVNYVVNYFDYDQQTTAVAADEMVEMVYEIVYEVEFGVVYD